MVLEYHWGPPLVGLSFQCVLILVRGICWFYVLERVNIFFRRFPIC